MPFQVACNPFHHGEFFGARAAVRHEQECLVPGMGAQHLPRIAFFKLREPGSCDKMLATNPLAVLGQVKREHAAFPFRGAGIAMSGRPDTFEVGRFASCSVRGTGSTRAQAAACDGQCREQADGSGNAGIHAHRQAGDWGQPREGLNKAL